MKNKKNGNKPEVLPFVSICTPTFNRRPFYPVIIKCFENQTYPKDRMEWIIIDDGTDKIEDLVNDIPQVRYFKYDTKMNLGKKRNLMHEKAKGDIIVYMDDDDYYPPERVSHAVEMLKKNPQALCAGSSEMYIYFKHIHKMYKFGPYGPNHSTAATFAFRKELLKQTRYDDNAALAEEREFLKGYTIPFVQLDSMKSILVLVPVYFALDCSPGEGHVRALGVTKLAPRVALSSGVSPRIRCHRNGNFRENHAIDAVSIGIQPRKQNRVGCEGRDCPRRVSFKIDHLQLAV